MISRRQMLARLRFMKKVLFSSSQRKHLWKWLASHEKNYLINNKMPWLAFDAIDFLSGLDLQGKKIFEYGSGGSTLYWLSKGAHCVSIEHDPEWHLRIKPSLYNGKRIDYRLIKPVYVNTYPFDPANPDYFSSGSPEFKNFSFRDYVEQIDKFPEGYFDLVLIDGRSRPACIKHSINKIKTGGILILDNADRDYYLKYTQDSLTRFTLKKLIGVGPGLDFWVTTNIYIRE